ncbi:hypothetical protein L226DRAFT_532375 [Lentinus tigrinus ALCF2SS1-7]|uniref:uncharacterized protein n=1 Tax=Lentinus tigrinus ALCF2SS1-7 TaxID=1328758 RepID=UPI001165E195|nr:hypothetical protein L226DRAFT_532375 [Lentinus tigrinus ALCF2SS1-7]
MGHSQTLALIEKLLLFSSRGRCACERVCVCAICPLCGKGEVPGGGVGSWVRGPVRSQGKCVFAGFCHQGMCHNALA